MKRNHLFGLIVCAGLITVATSAGAQDSVNHFTTADGTHVTLTSGQPTSQRYGPAPSFAQLDTNHDGYISRDEAQAYIPLFNDFDFLAHHAERISKRQFENWNLTQNR